MVPKEEMALINITMPDLLYYFLDAAFDFFSVI